jgi:HTH-type transcriptional regulator/antitoxin HigA
MEGVVMETSQGYESLARGVLKGFSIEKAGRVYATLCEIFPLHRVKTREQHKAALALLTKLSEWLHVGDKTSTPKRRQIMEYMDALGILVEAYEKKAFSFPLENISGAETLEYLIEEHDLRQSDLARELGSQSIVSEILSGKRKLNSDQILALSKRFHVSPSAFFP